MTRLDSEVGRPTAHDCGAVAGEATQVERRRRIWAPVIVGGSLLLVLVLLGVSAALALRYQPLQVGDAGATNVLEADGRLATPLTHSAAFGPLSESWRVSSSRYRVELMTTVLNSGPISVTIRSIRPAWDIQPGLRVLIQKPTNFNWNAGSPFHPVSVAPQHEVALQMNFWMNCQFNVVSGTGYVYDSVAVVYEFLGIDHTVQIPLSGALALYGPTHCIRAKD